MSGSASVAVLGAQVLAQRLEPLGGVDELHLAPAVRRLAVAEHPDIGRDAGVVEHVERQGDDGLQPVVLDDPAADVALALSGVAGEERTAVVHLGDAAAQPRVPLHLAQHVGQKHHLAVAGAGDERVVRVAVVLHEEAQVREARLAPHALQISLPALAVGRIGEHEVELAGGEGVVGQGGPEPHVVRLDAFALEDQVGLADGVGLRVDLLAVEVDRDLLAALAGELRQRLLSDREHPAGAAGAVVDQVGPRLATWSATGMKISRAMSCTTSLGVKCSPASSLFSSLKRRISSSKTVPMPWLSRPSADAPSRRRSGPGAG